MWQVMPKLRVKPIKKIVSEAVNSSTQILKKRGRPKKRKSVVFNNEQYDSNLSLGSVTDSLQSDSSDTFIPAKLNIKQENAESSDFNQTHELEGSVNAKLYKLDPDQKRKEQERNTAQKRLARMDPEYRKREQVRNTMSKRLARMDPEYRKKEQERNTESKRKARMDPDYRKREQERAKFAHQMAKLGLNPDGTTRVDRTKGKISRPEKPKIIDPSVINSSSTANTIASVSSVFISNQVIKSDSESSSVPNINIPTVSRVELTLPSIMQNTNLTRELELGVGCSQELKPSENTTITSEPPMCTNYRQNSNSSNYNEELQNVGLGANFNIPVNASSDDNGMAGKTFRNTQNVNSIHIPLVQPCLNIPDHTKLTGTNQLMSGNMHLQHNQVPVMDVSNIDIHDTNEEVVYLRI